MRTQAPRRACDRVGRASKIDWPEAGALMPTAACQAVALQYQKQVQLQNFDQHLQPGNVGLPDLTDKIRQSGMYETCKSWSLGAAKGVKGELSGSSADQPAVHHAAQR